MKSPKTADDVLTTNPAAAFHKFEHAMRGLVALPKSALSEKRKRKTAKKK